MNINYTSSYNLNSFSFRLENFSEDTADKIEEEFCKYLASKPSQKDMKPLLEAFSRANENIKYLGKLHQTIDRLFFKAILYFNVPKEMTFEYHQALQTLTEHMYNRNFQGEEDSRIYSSLVKSGLVFCCNTECEHLISLVDKERPSLNQSLEKQYAKESVDLFLRWFEAFKKEFLPQRILISEPLVRRYLKKLNETNLPYLSFFKQQIDKQILAVKSYDLIQAYLPLIQKLKTTPWDKWVISKITNKNRLKNLCFALKEFDVLRGLIVKEYPLNMRSKPAFHFLLDKMMIPTRHAYTGLKLLLTGKDLIRAIESVKLPSSIPSNLRKKICEEAIPLIRQCMIWNHAIDNNHSSVAIKEILFDIDNLQIGEKILVPLGCFRHQMCLLIEKISEDHFKLIQYNTGKGVPHWHPQWKDTNCFQTFLIFDQIPKKSLLQSEKWEVLFQDAFISENVDLNYQIIHQLAEGGLKRDPSGNRFDYEQKQAAGTCTAQCFMAFFRHQIMESELESPEKSYALYKFVKSRMLSRVGKKWLEEADEVIKKASITKMKKLKADIALANMAQDEKTVSTAWKQLKQLLIELGQTDLTDHLESLPRESQFVRYHVLREAQGAIARCWLEKQYEAPHSELYLTLALAKYEHQRQIISNMNENVKNSVLDKDWPRLAGELLNIIIATAHSDWGINWLVQNYQSENKEALSLLIEELAKYNSFGQRYIKRIKTAFQMAGKDEIAQFIADFG